MDELMKLNKEDLPRLIETKALRTAQILQVGLLVGPLIFILMVVGLKLADLSAEQPLPDTDADLIGALLLVLALLTLVLWGVAAVIPGLLLAPARLAAQAGRLGKGAPVAWMLSIHRTWLIIRMALLEAPALLGAVILLLAVMGNVAEAFPLAWLALVPGGLYLLYGLATFPNRARVAEFLNERILQPLRRGQR